MRVCLMDLSFCVPRQASVSDLTVTGTGTASLSVQSIRTNQTKNETGTEACVGVCLSRIRPALWLVSCLSWWAVELSLVWGEKSACVQELAIFCLDLQNLRYKNPFVLFFVLRLDHLKTRPTPVWCRRKQWSDFVSVNRAWSRKPGLTKKVQKN